MFERVFERHTCNPLEVYMIGDSYEVLNISEYGFAYYRNGHCLKSGLVENLNELVEMLIEDGWEEVL